jgi:excisionase family DNA binding protein
MASPEYNTSATARDADLLAFRPRDAARTLGLSERTLWGLTKAGKVPFVRIGKAVRYPRHLLLRWLEEQSRVAEVASHE